MLIYWAFAGYAKPLDETGNEEDKGVEGSQWISAFSEL